MAVTASVIGPSQTMNECLLSFLVTVIITVHLLQLSIIEFWNLISHAMTHGHASIPMMYPLSMLTTQPLLMIGTPMKFGLFIIHSEESSPIPSQTQQTGNTFVDQTCTRIPPPLERPSNAVKPGNRFGAWK